MFSYYPHSYAHPTHIVFSINEILYRVNIKKRFPEYVLMPLNLIKKYYINLNSGKLVTIDNEHEIMKTLRGPMKGNINFDGNYFRPAIQSDIDKNEKKNSDNKRLYHYLAKIYDNYEIFLSEDEMTSVHIRKSDENDEDLVLERYKKDNGVFKHEVSIILSYSVRDLEYCNGRNLREKYTELINKNLKSSIIRESLYPYVQGVFNYKDRYSLNYDSD